MSRKFEVAPVKREPTPLIVGIVAPSGAGKTKSGLRLLDGMRRVTGGENVVIDTEAGRAAHHSREHRFGHLKFAPPFGPLDYIEALKAAVDSGAKNILIDSMSHEWEGDGGVLDMHEEELRKKTKGDDSKRDSHNMAAWIRPKREHLKLKHFMLQLPCNIVMCFRAKEKIKPERGRGPVDLGWQALGAEDLTYEMLVRFLLGPGADGVPTPMAAPGLTDAEKALVKVPAWFRSVLAQPKQLDEDLGELLARFASGEDISPKPAATTQDTKPLGKLLDQLRACRDPNQLTELEVTGRTIFRSLNKGERELLGEVIKLAREQVAAAVSGEAGDAPPMTEEEMAEITRMEAGNA